MEGNRAYPYNFGRRPKVVLDKRFPIVKDMQFGDIGMVDAEISIEGVRSDVDDTGGEIKVVSVRINSLVPFSEKALRND